MAGRAEFGARHHGGPDVHVAVVADKNWRVITEAHYDLPDAFGCEFQQLQANVAGDVSGMKPLFKPLWYWRRLRPAPRRFPHAPDRPPEKSCTAAPT